MIEVAASTEIAGSPQAVWSALTELERFATWNPFIRAARGSTRVGGKVRVRVRPSFRLPLVFRARVLTSEPARQLRWRGHVLAPWLARGDHTFTIEPLASGKVRFAQRETFTGIVPRLTGRLLVREVRRGFEAMNRALAERVERSQAEPSTTEHAP